MSNSFKIMLISRLSKEKNRVEEKLLELPQLIDKEYNGLKYKHNPAETVYFIDSDLPENKSSSILSELKEEEYGDLRMFLEDDFSANDKNVPFYIFIHFGGDNFFNKCSNCIDNLNSGSTNFQFFVYAISSMDKKEIGAFSLIEFQEEFDSDNTGASLFKKAQGFSEEFNLFKLEEQILPFDKASVLPSIKDINRIGIVSEILVPDLVGLPMLNYKEGIRGIPEFLRKLITENHDVAESKVVMRFLLLSEVLKRDNAHELDLDSYLYSDEKKPCIYVGMLDLEYNQAEVRNLVDQRFLFFDSSIWFRYISFRNIGKILELKAELEANFEMGLYDLPASQEFYEFQKRLFNNSYITRIEDNISHGGMITPFTFHSERQMEKLADKVQNEICEDMKSIGDWKWNILFYDDNAEGKKAEVIAALLELQEEEEILDQNGNVVRKVYATKISSSREEVNMNFHFFIESNMRKGQKAIENTLDPESQDDFFDIILLDYLFVEDEDHFTLSDKFIVNLLDDNEEKNFGYFDQLWFFPVSVYQGALLNELGNAGISYYEGNAIFSEGADPISTPHLFRYKFYKFLQLQLQKLKSSRSGKSFREIVDEGVSEIDKGYEKLREWASEYYDDIVLLGGIFEKLCLFKNRSTFAESALNNLFYKLYAPEDWYQIRILFYHLANSSKSQKPLVLESMFYFNKHGQDNPLFEKLKKIIANYYK